MPKGNHSPIKYSDFIKNQNFGTEIPLYLFYGEERFLIQEGVALLEERFLSFSSKDFNFQLLYGNETTAVDIIHTCQTLPLFSPQRLVILKNFDLLPSAEQDRMVAYFLNPCPTTCLVVTAEKIDLRKKSCQAIQANGIIISCSRLYESQIPYWVKNKAQTLGMKLTDGAIGELSSRIGSDLSRLIMELEKLSLYCRNQSTPIDRDRVLLVLGGEKDQSVFDLIGKIGEKNLEASLLILNNLLEGGNHPLMILTLLIRQYRLIWRAKNFRKKNVPPNEMIKQLGLHPYFGQKILKQAENYSDAELHTLFILFRKLDASLKDSVHSPKMLLESLLFQLCASEATVLEE